jgi:hypothetical protein
MKMKRLIISRNSKAALAAGLAGIALAALSGQTAHAEAGGLSRSLEGGHHGKVVSGSWDGKGADLVLRKIPGRGSSMIGALVIDDDRAVYFYQVDYNMNKGDWVMIPITATRDGEVIAAADTNPSLTLKRTLDKHQSPVLEINSANSPNHTGFEGVVDFPEHDWWHSEYQWQQLKEGVYKCHRGCEGSATVTAPLLVEKNEGSITLRLNSLSGDFRMRLKAEEIFAVHAWSEKDTGSEQAEIPARLAISVRKGSSDRILLSNPEKAGYVESLERR